MLYTFNLDTDTNFDKNNNTITIVSDVAKFVLFSHGLWCVDWGSQLLKNNKLKKKLKIVKKKEVKKY